MDDSDDMSRILNGNTNKKTSINSWITEVIWNEKDDDEDLEEDTQCVDEDGDDDYDDDYDDDL